MADFSIAGSSGTTGVSQLTAPASGDKMPIVDVSDTSTAPAGSAGSDKYVNFGLVRGTRCLNVLDYGADPSDTSDNHTAFAAALTAMGSGSGEIFFPGNATYKLASSWAFTLLDAQRVVLQFEPGVTIDYHGTTGAAIAMHGTGTDEAGRFAVGSGIDGSPVIDGTNATAGLAAVEFGDIFQGVLNADLNNWDGAASIGAHILNKVAQTEQLFARIRTDNCKQSWVFDVSGTGNGSFERGDYEFYVNQVDPAADGLVMKNGAVFLGNALRLKGNFGGSSGALTSCVIRIGDGTATASQISKCMLDVDVECAAGTNKPQTIVFGTGSGNNALFQCWGQLDFSGDQQFAASNNTGNFNEFAGVIAGDDSLLSGLGFGTTVALAGGVSIGNNITAQSLTNGSTLALGAAGDPAYLPVTSAAAVTGILMPAQFSGSNIDGQIAVVKNTGSFPVTFAAVGSSLMSNGTGEVIPAGAAVMYIYNQTLNLWNRVGPQTSYAYLTIAFTSANAGGAQNVTGLAAVLGIGTWKVRGWFPYVGAGTVGDTKTFAFTFSGTASGSAGYVAWTESAAAYKAPTVGAAVTTSATTATTVSTVYVMEFEGTVVVSAAGTLQLTVTNNTANVDEVTIEAGARLEVTQVG